MSAATRRKAQRIIPRLTEFAPGIPMSGVKLGRCMREYFTVKFRVPDSTQERTAAYNYSGHYVGNTRTAARLARRGISPELADESHSVCSIGRSSKDGKWYGWSHRALHGFKKGMTVKEGDCTREVLPVGFQATNEEDKRQMAIAFAESVS